MVLGMHTDVISHELFKFSIETMAWTKLDMEEGVTGTGPSARVEHSTTSVGNDIYLFGGYPEEGERKIKPEGGREEERGRWWKVRLAVVLGYGGWYCTGVGRVLGG